MSDNLSMAVILAAAMTSLAGCGPIQTHNTVVIEQPAPLVVNVNLTGRLELVITDARQDMETITGQKAKREVRPEDIGLPPTNSGSAGPMPETMVLTLADYRGTDSAWKMVAATAPASEDPLVSSMAARNTKVRALLSAHVAGEGHDGLLAERATMTAEQRAVMDAENKDRTELYKLRATKNKTTVADAALAYYLQRLGYAEKGDWVETYNKTSKQWEWVKWAG